MLDWLTENANLVSSLATFIMALVWVFYAQLFYRDFINRRHPRLMIHQAPDAGPDATCLVINMGKQIVNVAPILAVGRTRKGDDLRTEITDYRNVSSDQFPEVELTRLLKQGPIGPGDYIHLGSFNDIAASLTEEEEKETAEGRRASAIREFQRLEVRVVLFSGDGPSPIGAWRAFSVQQRNGGVKVKPVSHQTHQMTSLLKRRQVRKWMETTFQ